MSPKSLKITIFSSLTKNLAKYIFFTKINFLFNFFDHVQQFLIICNILVMCNLHMICKMPIFPYFTLKSNIHHISNIKLHIDIIKIYVNSNIFELIPIVYIICKKIHQNIIFYHFPPIPLKVCKISHTTHFREFPAKFPLNFPLGKNLAQFPFAFSGQTKIPFKKINSIK